ncbi:MAG: CAP family protein [Pseudanabaena sp. ELA607]
MTGTIDLVTLRSEALANHNKYRATHHSPAMSAQTALDSTCQQWAEYLSANGVFQHSTPAQRNNAGENIYVYYTTASAPTAVTIAKEAVASWYNEVKDYDYTKAQFASNTGHFTQVVWQASTGLGTGAAIGTKVMNGTTFNAIYVVCQYAPTGNMSGAFAANVLKP